LTSSFQDFHHNVSCASQHLRAYYNPYPYYGLLFSGEGTRSRGYGRTAALRLILQTCDEDEKKYGQFFSFFQAMEHRWNEIYRGKPKYSGKNLSQCHFVHDKSHTDWYRPQFYYP
jgi:hypothetical protein